MTRPSSPARSAHPAEGEHLERQPRPDPAGDHRRRRHRADPEQQPEPGAEGGAGEDDEEEEPGVVAGEVDEAEQSCERREHAEHRDGRAVHRAAAHLERDRANDERADERGDERGVAAVGLLGERLRGSQNG